MKLGIDSHGIVYVLDVRHMRSRAHKVEEAIINTAKRDTKKTVIGIFQDPGSAGKGEAETMIRKLVGWIVKSVVTSTTHGKINYASPASAYCEAGNVKLVRAYWNDPFLNELEQFPDGKHDDRVDAFSLAFNLLTKPVSKGSAMRVSRSLPGGEM